MKIGKYISELLYSHERIILPDFGTFSTTYVPAKFIAEKNIVESPARIADFSSFPKEGETPLTGYIAEKEGMSESAVNEFFGKLVHEIHQSLEAGKKVELENIGMFSLDENGNIHFSANREINYLREDTGVSSVKAPPFNPPATAGQKAEENSRPDAADSSDGPDQDKETNRHEEGAATPAQQGASKEQNASAQDPHGEQTQEEDLAAAAVPPPADTTPAEPAADKKPAGGINWFVAIGVPLLVLIVIALLNFNYFFGDDGVFRKPATVEEVETVPSEPVTLPDSEIAEETAEETTEEITDPIPVDPSVEPPSPEPGRPIYYIVVGSFRNESEARKLARQLRTDGASLASVFMTTPAEYHRVCYGYYYDLEEAQNQKASLDDELREKAWILHR